MKDNLFLSVLSCGGVLRTRQVLCDPQAQMGWYPQHQNSQTSQLLQTYWQDLTLLLSENATIVSLCHFLTLHFMKKYTLVMYLMNKGEHSKLDEN